MYCIVLYFIDCTELILIILLYPIVDYNYIYILTKKNM